MVDLRKSKDAALSKLEQDRLAAYREQLDTHSQEALNHFEEIKQQHLAQQKHQMHSIHQHYLEETSGAFNESSRHIKQLNSKIDAIEKSFSDTGLPTRLKLYIAAAAIAGIAALAIMLLSASFVSVKRHQLSELKSQAAALEARVALLTDAKRIGTRIAFESGRYVFHLPSGHKFKRHVSVNGLQNLGRNAWYIDE
ncbi:hypothetical protein [Roseovarius sp. EL26]|uniref:hypothetical protein n=1 Tax=Roseovarius sp. EL26 TaxID=2126672 RepID=UPI000EA315CA|nr:hypothetical protein [Roseovarius sp. EL26]